MDTTVDTKSVLVVAGHHRGARVDVPRNHKTVRLEHVDADDPQNVFMVVYNVWPIRIQGVQWWFATPKSYATQVAQAQVALRHMTGVEGESY